MSGRTRRGGRKLVPELTRRGLLVCVAASAACFNPEPPVGLDTDASTGAETDAPTTTDPTTGTSPTSGDTTTTSTPTTTSTTPTTQGSTTIDSGSEGSSGAASCGDGVLEGDEVCDDENTQDGDGCSSACTPEDGWQCDAASPSLCTAPDLGVRVMAAAFVAGGLQLTYVVTNNGGLESGPYRVDLWDTRTGGFDSPPGLGEDGVVTFSDKPSLPAGGMQLFNDTIPSPVNGTHVAFAVVDSADEIVEQDENDNVALGMAWTNAGLTVHRSFVSPEVPVAIPADTDMVTVGVDVSVPVSVPEVFFSVNISHPDVSDLELRAIAPNGAVRDLVLGTPGGENFQSTTIRAGGADINAAVAPYAGEFVFAGAWGSSPAFNGEWTLQVTSPSGTAGRINGFSVSFFEIDP